MESCTLFEVKLPDERVLKYQGMCRKVKLTVQDQEITNDLFLLPLENYDVLGRVAANVCEIFSGTFQN